MNQGPNAEEIARAIVEEQERAKAAKGKRLSNTLGVLGLLAIPVSLYLWTVDASLGSSVCGGAALLIVVGAIVGSVTKR